MNFCQFWNAINGEPYHDIPPPVKYNLKTLGDETSYANVENGQSQLRPLTHEDMGRYAADDVVAHYVKMHNGKNPMSLGEPLTDSEFKDFLGQTW
jgi:hypothetical protein